MEIILLCAISCKYVQTYPPNVVIQFHDVCYLSTSDNILNRFLMPWPTSVYVSVMLYRYSFSNLFSLGIKHLFSCIVSKSCMTKYFCSRHQFFIKHPYSNSSSTGVKNHDPLYSFYEWSYAHGWQSRPFIWEHL